MAPKSRRAETRQARPLDKRARWRQKHPWARLVEWARRRCKDTESKWYQFYGARGITCSITAKDVEAIWFRDGADGMKRPSLDRIESAKGYAVGNIRIVEFAANARMAWDESFRFLYNCDYDERRAAASVLVPAPAEDFT